MTFNVPAIRFACTARVHGAGITIKYSAGKEVEKTMAEIVKLYRIILTAKWTNIGNWPDIIIKWCCVNNLMKTFAEITNNVT